MKDRLYFGDLFADYAQGVQLDVRAKFALDLARSATQGEWAGGAPGVVMDLEEAADTCAGLAAALFRNFEERGWLRELPMDDQLDMGTRKHLARGVRGQAVQAAAAHRISDEEAPKLETAIRGAIKPRQQ